MSIISPLNSNDRSIPLSISEISFEIRISFYPTWNKEFLLLEKIFTKKQVILSPGFSEWLWEGLVVSHLPYRRRLGLCRRLIFAAAAGRVHAEIKAVDGCCLAGNDHHVVGWCYRYFCCCCGCWCSLDRIDRCSFLLRPKFASRKINETAVIVVAGKIFV